MSRGEWNKKEELLAEQAAKHLRHYTPLLAAFAQSAKAEIALLTKVHATNICDTLNKYKINEVFYTWPPK